MMGYESIDTSPSGRTLAEALMYAAGFVAGLMERTYAPMKKFRKPYAQCRPVQRQSGCKLL